jgi:hypothetical protein
MRMKRFIAALLLSVLISGCSRSGDFSAFMVSDVAKYGGRTVTNTALPTLQARWKIKNDANGFRAFITGASFSQIDELMHQAFGAPKVSVPANASGEPHRVWSAGDIGVAIQLIRRPNGAEVICVRGVRSIGELF